MDDFGFFDIFSIDEDEPVITSKKVKCTTLKDWPKLPNEVKQLVIANIGFETRLNLSLCSKSDYENVKNSRMKIKEMHIVEEDSWVYGVYDDPVKFVNIEIDFDFEKHERFELKFVKDGDSGCALVGNYRHQYKKKKSVCTKHDYKTEALDFAIHCMKRCDFKIKCLTVQMEECSFQSNLIKNLKHLKYLRLSSNNEDQILWWMDKAKQSKLKTLQFCKNRDAGLRGGTLSAGFMEKVYTQLNGCDTFYFWACPLFSDQQFLNLNAKNINFDVGSSLSDQSINRFIRNWVEGKTRKDFVQFIGWMKRGYQKESILKNLDGKLWDDEFIENSRGFTFDFERVVGRGDCYQVQNKCWNDISATLMLSSDRVTFLVTGRVYMNRMSYSVPVT